MSFWTKAMGHTTAACLGVTVVTLFITAVAFVWHIFQVLKLL